MAEAILKSKYLLEELEIESKGLVVLFPEPVNPKTEAVLEENGLNVEGHAAAELVQADLQPRNLILVMTAALKKKISEEFENPVNVHLLTEYAENPVTLQVQPGDTGRLCNCFRRMEETIRKLVIELNEEELLC